MESISSEETLSHSDVIRLEKRVADLEMREAALCIENKYLRELYDCAPLAYQSLGENGHIIEVNQVWLNTFGYTRQEIIGKKSSDFLHPDRRDLFNENFSKCRVLGEILDVEFEIVKKDGSFLFMSCHGKIGMDSQDLFLQTHCVLRDITERKRAEGERKSLQKQLQQAQKLEAIGTLAGGIAHDFNNILGVMIGFTDMVLDDIPPGSRIEKDLDKVLRAGYRGKDLVAQILAFSRLSPDEPVPLQLRSIIKEVLKMLRASLPATIKIKQKLEASCGPVEADPSQIHQVLMNLCTNAYHAMEENGGVLTIELRSAQSLPASLHHHAGETRIQFLELIVSDTGVGIEADILDLIFDPFFTTKAKGKGTGMGLSIAYGIVQKYNGTISVESTAGSGTTFHVFLPESSREVPLLTVYPECRSVGKEHIMFIDDELLLVEMAETMLERLGYTVSGLTDSRKALEVFSASPDDFDLVITDQTMPEMTGLELAKAMMRIRPTLPIIMCTGYSSHVNEAIAQKHGIRRFLYKPIVKGNLAQVMRDIFAST